MRAVIIDGVKMYEVIDKLYTEAEFEATFLGGDEKGCSITAWTKPIDSDALAVHPDQIPEVMERNRKHGLHVEYDHHGRPRFRDRGARRDLIKVERAHGLPVRDRDGGYSDG